MATTGGTGGSLTDRTGVPFLASNGYDSFSHIYAAGIDTSKPIGLFVWLHGDGAYEYLNPTSTLYLAGPDGIVAAAKERNCIVLVPLTPDSGTANGRTWWKWGAGNAQYLRELIVSEIYGKYNIDLGKIWIAGFSGGAETTTAIFLPTQANNLQIEGGGFMPFGGGPRPSWYEVSEAWTPNFDPATFPGYWIVGENDTAANAEDGYDGRLAAESGHAWYGTKGFPTDIYYVPGQTHVLSPEWGNLMRAAWVKYDSTGGGNITIGGAGISSMFVGSTPVAAVYVGSQKVWPTIIKEVVQITLGTHLEARDQLRAAMSDRGLDYQTVTEIPFEIELVGTGSVRSLLSNCEALTSVPTMDTSQVTNMYSMFYNCSALTHVPDMDTSGVTDMYSMFYNCSALTHVPDMDTSGVTDMQHMFRGCSALTHVPDMDTSGVTNMRSMFNDCSSLTSAPVMDTSSVTETAYMFRNCAALTDVPDMDTSSVTDTGYMFYNCAALTDGNVRLIGRHPNVNTASMIGGSGLTRLPFYDTAGNPI